MLRVVLTNSPNSCPPESLFSIFNSTYNDDQKRCHTGPDVHLNFPLESPPVSYQNWENPLSLQREKRSCVDNKSCDTVKTKK